MKRDPTLAPFLEACDAISAFEMSPKCVHWRFRGFHLWPIAKYVLVKQLIAAMNAGYAPTDRYQTYPGFAHRMRVKTDFKSLLKRLRPSPPVQDDLPLEHLTNQPIWILGSASGFYDLNGQSVCQHHHALREALHDGGVQSLGLYSGGAKDETLSPLPYGPDASLNSFIHHVTQRASVRPLSAAYLTRHFDGLDAVIATTGHSAEAIFAYIDTLIGRVAYTIKRFTPIFQTAPPRAVFSSNYASFYGWALAYLCRRYNRPFTDIQHGIQGHYNGAYYFARTPKEDWRISPQAQLSWSAPDAALFCAGHPSRKASIIGPTWEGLAPFLPALSPAQTLRSGVQANHHGPLLVYIGQAAEDVHIAAKLAQRGLNIVFRAHPMRRNMSAELVSDTVWAALEGDRVSDMALPHLLAQAQGIVTGYSAVILEAGLQGLSCFAIGGFARLVSEDYAEALNDRLSLVQPEAERDLIDQIVDWAAHIPPSGNTLPRARVPMGDALRAIGLLPDQTSKHM